jgi:integrase
MSVRKRQWQAANGEIKNAWVCDYFDQHGKRRNETFPTEKQAKLREAQVRLDISKGKHVALDTKATVADIARRWLKQVEVDGRERATLAGYRQHVNLHILGTGAMGRVKVAKLTPEMIEAFRNLLLDEKDEKGEPKRSRKLAIKVWITFKGILKHARVSHLAASVDGIKTDKRGKPRLEEGRDFPTSAEIRRLIEATATLPKKRALLLMAAFTGLRASELRGLRWHDVDLPKGELHVRQRADRYHAIGAPKSDSSRRRVPLDAGVLIPALKVWKLACPKGPLDLVFPTMTGKIESHGNLLRSLWPVMRDAGVVKVTSKGVRAKYAMHAFRHYFASWSIMPESRGGRGIPPKIVQEWLGHSTIAMTLDMYSHCLGEPDADELKKSVAAVLA